MAVTMNKGFAGDRAERQPETTGLGLANQKLLEQQCVGTDTFCRRVGTQ